MYDDEHPMCMTCDRLPARLGGPVARLLASGIGPINFEYDCLTSVEQSCITPDEFADLADWVRTELEKFPEEG